MKHKQTYPLLSILALLLLSLAIKANPTDSLLNVLSRAKSPQERCTIYRNLADFHEGTPSENYYLHKTIEAAHLCRNVAHEMGALRDMAVCYGNRNQPDSAMLYLEQLKSLPEIPIKKGLVTSLNMFLFKVMFNLDRSSEVVDKESKKYDIVSRQKDNLYDRIECAFNIASALYKDDNPQSALPYLLEANKMAAQLPFREGYYIRQATLKGLAHYCLVVGDYKKAMDYSKEVLSLYDEYYEKYIRAERPFFKNESSYLSVASTLIISVGKVEPGKLHEYAQKIEALLLEATNPLDKYRGFLGMNNYYLMTYDYKMALATNDSLIKYATILLPENLPGLYDISSQIFEAMGEYKKALTSLRKSASVKDSLSTSDVQKQLSELQVKYNLDRLMYEKSQLENKTRLILVICLSVILLIVLLICLYLYRNLKKEQRLKIYMRMLMDKAEESEEMKTSFINSICHEIRTPLNGIVGFTSMILDETIDEDLRVTFPEEIQRNVNSLTSLINVMLEISNLDVSDEKFVCEPVIINHLCEHEMDRMGQLGKPELKFQLELPQGDVIANSHKHYFALVLEQLLSNANKFTSEGTVVLSLTTDEEQHALTLRVSDTGCGIPLDKQKQVFDRFLKLDTYVPGNGLGLYLCKLIMKRMGGDICIDPTYSPGTSVIITLPLA